MKEQLDWSRDRQEGRQMPVAASGGGMMKDDLEGVTTVP